MNAWSKLANGNSRPPTSFRCLFVQRGQHGLARDPRFRPPKPVVQPRHEVVHVVAARGGAPFGVVLQQLDIEPVETAGPRPRISDELIPTQQLD